MWELMGVVWCDKVWCGVGGKHPEVILQKVIFFRFPLIQGFDHISQLEVRRFIENWWVGTGPRG